METNNKRYYNCFSPRQFKYLVMNGFEPVAIKYHKDTGAKFYIFMNSKELSLTLDVYTRITES